jgi:hypothetical protein
MKIGLTVTPYTGKRKEWPKEHAKENLSLFDAWPTNGRSIRGPSKDLVIPLIFCFQGHLLFDLLDLLTHLLILSVMNTSTPHIKLETPYPGGLAISKEKSARLPRVQKSSSSSAPVWAKSDAALSARAEFGFEGVEGCQKTPESPARSLNLN